MSNKLFSRIIMKYENKTLPHVKWRCAGVELECEPASALFFSRHLGSKTTERGRCSSSGMRRDHKCLDTVPHI